MIGSSRRDAMTQLTKALTVVATILVGSTALVGSALAVDSPFYPDNFKNPTLPHPSVGSGSGIPSQYRLGD
jgi:hypothetical protein